MDAEEQTTAEAMDTGGPQNGAAAEEEVVQALIVVPEEPAASTSSTSDIAAPAQIAAVEAVASTTTESTTTPPPPPLPPTSTPPPPPPLPTYNDFPELDNRGQYYELFQSRTRSSSSSDMSEDGGGGGVPRHRYFTIELGVGSSQSYLPMVDDSMHDVPQQLGQSSSSRRSSFQLPRPLPDDPRLMRGSQIPLEYPPTPPRPEIVLRHEPAASYADVAAAAAAASVDIADTENSPVDLAFIEAMDTGGPQNGAAAEEEVVQALIVVPEEPAASTSSTSDIAAPAQIAAVEAVASTTTESTTTPPPPPLPPTSTPPPPPPLPTYNDFPELDNRGQYYELFQSRTRSSSSSDMSEDGGGGGVPRHRYFTIELGVGSSQSYLPMVDDSMHDVPQQLGQSSSSRRSSFQLPRPLPDDPRLMRGSQIPLEYPPTPPRPEIVLRHEPAASYADVAAAAAAASVDIADTENSPVDLAFIEDRTRPWYVSPRTVQLAIRQVLSTGRRSEGGIAPLLNRATFMQRMRRVIFSMGHDADTDDLSGDSNDGDDDIVGGGAEVVANNVAEGEAAESDRNAAAAERAADEARENAVRFNTELPAEHSYLGTNMDRVSGVNYLEAGQCYRMMLFKHQHILYPGEVLPFMISPLVIDSDIDAQNGLLFGVCFTFLNNNADRRNSETMARNNAGDIGLEDMEPTVYGVTCQIYERGIDSSGNAMIKSRALQRFVVKKSEISGSLQFIAAHPQFKRYGTVRILEEIYLPEPLRCINMGSMNRFRDSASMSQMYRRYQAASTPWPAHIYDSYSITRIVEKARTQLAHHKINTMPTDPTQLSFWLVRNLALSEDLMKTIFMTDSVNTRLMLISSTFKEDDIFTCRYCDNRIANCRELFAMSKHGVQTQYCNSAGYIHETNTVYQLLRHAVSYSGTPSAEFSWFPGYRWHIIVCKICNRHIGWEFMAVEENLVPRLFYGISSYSVRVSAANTLPTNPREMIYRNFMAIARGEAQ